MAGVVEGSLSEDAGSLPQALSSVRSSAPSSPSALAELLGSASIGQTLDDLGRGLTSMRTQLISALEALHQLRSKSSETSAALDQSRAHASYLEKEVATKDAELRRYLEENPSAEAKEEQRREMARLEAAAGNALDRLKASQQALRKGVAVSRQLTAAACAAAGLADAAQGAALVGSGPEDGWDGLLAAHSGALREIIASRESLEGCVEAAQQRVITAEKRAEVAEARASAAEEAQGRAHAEHQESTGTALSVQWGSVRLLARALRPLRVRCYELGCQKALLRSQLAHTESLLSASEHAVEAHMETRSRLEAELSALVGALCGGDADGSPALSRALAAVQFEEDGASDANSVNGGAFASRRAMRHWRVAWIAVSAINRLQRMHKSPGSYLGLRVRLGDPALGAARAAVALAPDHLVRAEWLPPPGAPQSLPSQGWEATGGSTELMGEAATLLLLIKQLEGSAGKVRDGSGSNNPSDAAAGPPPWLRRGSVSSIHLAPIDSLCQVRGGLTSLLARCAPPSFASPASCMRSVRSALQWRRRSRHTSSRRSTLRARAFI